MTDVSGIMSTGSFKIIILGKWKLRKLLNRFYQFLHEANIIRKKCPLNSIKISYGLDDIFGIKIAKTSKIIVSKIWGRYRIANTSRGTSVRFMGSTTDTEEVLEIYRIKY